MKHRIRQVLAGITMGLVLVCASQGRVLEQSVQVRSGQIRERASFLSPVTREVSYGDRVTTGAQTGPWLEVQEEGQPVGWIHSSAVTRKVIRIKAGDKDVDTRVSDDELALAGKGFTQQVEEAYRAENGDAGFDVIDQMEKTKVSHRQMVRFLKEGDLNSSERGRP